LYAFLIYPTRATCLAHLTLLNSITLIFGEAYKLWSSSLCSLLHTPLTFPKSVVKERLRPERGTVVIL
jgi:hypothetical protein